MTTARTCGDAGGVTKSGSPCKSYLNLSDGGLCLQHDPERAVERRAFHVAGGAAAGVALRKERALPPGMPKAPKTIQDAEKFASWLTRAVCAGEIDARTAHEAAVCLREFRGASEKRILEAQVKALRADLAAAKRERARGA